MRRAGRSLTAPARNFGLDGGRTLQLGGASTATGADEMFSIDLNATNPNSGLSDAGSGTLTIVSGATFNDQTTTNNGLMISATAMAAATRVRRRGGEQPRHVHQERVGGDLDDLGRCSTTPER